MKALARSGYSVTFHLQKVKAAECFGNLSRVSVFAGGLLRNFEQSMLKSSCILSTK